MKTKKNKKVDRLWVVEDRYFNWNGNTSVTFHDLGDAMDHIDTLHKNGMSMSKIALYKAVRVPLPK